MNISDIPEDTFTLPKEPNKNLRFVKNEEGKRVAQQLHDSDIEEMKTKKDIGIVVIGHIGHAQMEILEILNSHDFANLEGKVVIVASSESPDMPGYIGSMMDEKLKEFNKTPLVIKSIREEFAALFLEKPPKPYSRFTANRYTLKPQKSKAGRQKYTQRKK